MARIRQVKPEFFRHGGLQDLEAAHPGKYPMFVYEGLWTVCDKAGRFVWDPRQIKLDVLPFLPFDMAETLAVLEGAGYLRRYVVDGVEYGYVPTFEKHQRITGKESQGEARYPAPTPESESKASENQTGRNGETPEKHPGAQYHGVTESRSHGVGALASPDGEAARLPLPSDPLDEPHPDAPSFPCAGKSGGEWRATRRNVAEWGEAFPDVAMIPFLRKMRAKVQAGAVTRKVNYPRAVVKWLANEQDGARSGRAGSASAEIRAESIQSFNERWNAAAGQVTP